MTLSQGEVEMVRIAFYERYTNTAGQFKKATEILEKLEAEASPDPFFTPEDAEELANPQKKKLWN